MLAHQNKRAKKSGLSRTKSKQYSLQLNADVLMILKQISTENNKDQKINKIQKLRQHISEIKDSQLENEINNKACKQFIELIGDGISEDQRLLLSIIGVIVERGVQIEKRQTDNIFYDPIKKSGLYKSLDAIYVQQIQKQNEKYDKKINFSDFITQLIYTYTFINKNKKIESKRLKQAWNLFKHLIYALDRKLVIQEWMYDFRDNQQRLQRYYKKVDGRMVEVKRVIQIIQGLIDQQTNRNCFIRKFKCQYCLIHMINLYDYPDRVSSLELKSAVYQTFAVLSSDNDRITRFLVKDKNIFNNIAPYVVNYSYYIQHQRIIRQQSHSSSSLQQQNPSRNQTISISYLKIIASISQLLNNLIENNNQIEQRAGSTVGFVKSVAELSLFKDQIDEENQQRKQLHSEIRFYNQQYFNSIRQYCLYQELKRIIKKLKFVQSEIDLIVADCENEDLKSQFLKFVFLNISNIIVDLQNGTKYYHSKPTLLKEIDEQLEEVGGLEEIDLNIKRISDTIKHLALHTLKQIINPINVNKAVHNNNIQQVDQDSEDKEDEQENEVVKQYYVVFDQTEENINNNEPNNNEQEEDDEETNYDDVDYDEDSSSSQRRGRRHSYAFDDGDEDDEEEKCNIQ